MKAVLPAYARGRLAPYLPPAIEPRWFSSPDEANAMIVDADIAWVDMTPTSRVAEAIRRGARLKWVSTLYAGLDAFPLDHLKALGATLTNGAGITAYAVAEYAVLGVLAAAKRFDEVVRLYDRREWPADSPGKVELFETKALVIGFGAIGRLIGERLAAFGVAVTGVRRAPDPACIGPDDWRPRLAEFDWVILAAPSTNQTKAMIGAVELAAMKPGAWLINIARGDMIDEAALLVALHDGTIAGAFLDPTNPEPLPADHPLWRAPNTMITMHLSGRSQTRMFERATALFLENVPRFLAGQPLRNTADLDAGY